MRRPYAPSGDALAGALAWAHGRRALLTEQLDYYRARAGEYDSWWLRQGRFDRGAEANAAWFAEAAELEACSRGSRRAATCSSWPAGPGCGRATWSATPMR